MAATAHRVDVIRTLTLTVLLLPTLSAIVRAQAPAPPLPAVVLHWQGPPACAQPTGVQEAARGQLDREPAPSETLTVKVQLQEQLDGGLRIAFEAHDAAGLRARRELTVPSCEDARQAVALFVALTLDPQPPGASDASEPSAAPVATTAPAPTAAPSTTTAPAPTTAPATTAAPKAEPSQEPRATSPPDRAGPAVGVVAGLELPAPAPTPVLGARVGLRLGAIELEAQGSVWLPARSQGGEVELEVTRFGGSAAGCHWFALGVWELGPCLGLELTRLGAELNGEDAGAAAWLRASLGPRLGLWLAPRVVLSVSADAMLALHRPRFSSAGGFSALPPAASFVSRVGIAYALGAGSRARDRRP